ncbi:hypothetical protein J6590_078977, partial [Homalodisca vitripennis]
WKNLLSGDENLATIITMRLIVRFALIPKRQASLNRHGSGKVPHPIEIQEENLGHQSKVTSPQKKGRPALNHPIQS